MHDIKGRCPCNTYGLVSPINYFHILFSFCVQGVNLSWPWRCVSASPGIWLAGVLQRPALTLPILYRPWPAPPSWRAYWQRYSVMYTVSIIKYPTRHYRTANINTPLPTCTSMSISRRKLLAQSVFSSEVVLWAHAHTYTYLCTYSHVYTVLFTGYQLLLQVQTVTRFALCILLVTYLTTSSPHSKDPWSRPLHTLTPSTPHSRHWTTS